jgi:predicted  nucleic acid-binding Zn-ribbon protein
MSRAASLLQLQIIDLELDAHRARLAAIQAALSDDPALREAQRGTVEAEAQLHAARVELQNLEFDAIALNEKIGEISERMYNGGVTNPKQLQELQQDLESLKRRRAALEERQFEALVAVESAEVRQNGVQHALQQAEAHTAEAHGSLVDERNRLQTDVARLEQGREAVLGSIGAADRDVYAQLRQSKRGRPVTRLEDGMCASCGVAPSSSRIQSARQGNELVLCGNCGRILCAD